jgi:opacity protein-like surface antigen
MGGGFVRCILVMIVASATFAVMPAGAQDDDDEDEKPEVLVSIDVLATYLKASGFSLGFGMPRLSTLTLTSPSSQSFTVDAPLKVEFDGWFRLYAGLGGAMSKSGSGSWSSFKPDSWKTGFSADVITQGEGQWVPTVTVTGSMTRPLDHAAIVQTTTWTAGLDLDLAVDVEQTRGMLAGAGYTYVTVDRGLGTIHPATLLYAGAYRQFGEWKLSATAGVQFSDGAQLGNLIRVAPVDIKFVRAELEKLDDDDNRLMALAVAVGWSPKPSVQLTLNVPLYFNR